MIEAGVTAEGPILGMGDYGRQRDRQQLRSGVEPSPFVPLVGPSSPCSHSCAPLNPGNCQIPGGCLRSRHSLDTCVQPRAKLHAGCHPPHPKLNPSLPSRQSPAAPVHQNGYTGAGPAHKPPPRVLHSSPSGCLTGWIRPGPRPLRTAPTRTWY